MRASHTARMLPESRFYRAVRQYVLTAPVWATDLVQYQTLPDETWDLTLVSQRVYGTRDEFLAIMACAGLDRVNQPLTERLLRLPNRQRLEMLKSSCGYSSTVANVVR